MISNPLTTIDNLSNDNLIKLDWAKYLREKYANNSQRFSTDRNIVSIKYDDNTMSKIDTHQSTHVSYHLFSQSKPIFHEKNLTHQSISTSDCVDWTNHQSKQSSIAKNQLNTIDLLDEIIRDIQIQSYSAMNNNHFHSRSRLNSNFQFSNNKEKKNKKEKSDEKEKKDETDNETKKSKKKTIKIEESTTDSDSMIHSPSALTPTQASINSPKSPVETSGFPSLSIPVPHPSGSASYSFISPDTSRIQVSQQSNIAHLSQVQQQLQTDLQNSPVNKTTSPHNMSVQQQLQSLSQMARDGDEILITLSVNALTQKQQINNHSQQNQFSFPTNPYSSQTWNSVTASSTGTTMPRNLEIVAKGFARVQHEHPQPPPSNPYLQQPSMMYAYNQQPQTLLHPAFAARYSMPCHSNSGPPPVPIGPPIQPIFPPPTPMMSERFNQSPKPANFTSSRRNYSDDYHNCPHRNSARCDSLCQSSLYQPDFRGRPSPGVTINPYISHSSAPRNFSAKHSSKKTQSYNLNFDDINRTYSSIY